MTNDREVAALVKKVRRQRRLDHREVASRALVSVSDIWRLERGEQIDADKRKRIVDAILWREDDEPRADLQRYSDGG